MRDHGNAQSFALKRLWEVRLGLEAVWVMTAGHFAAVWILEVAVPHSAISGVATEEHWSDSSEL